jgi:hypothetical protein
MEIDVLAYRVVAAKYAARFAEGIREDVYQSFLLGVMEAAQQGIVAPSDLAWKGRVEADKIVRGDWVNPRPFNVVEGEDGEELDEMDMLTQDDSPTFIKVGNVYHHSGELADSVGNVTSPDPLYLFGFDRDGKRITEPDEAECQLRRRGLSTNGLGGNAWVSETEEVEEQDSIASSILVSEDERVPAWMGHDWDVTEEDEARVQMIRDYSEEHSIGYEKALDALGFTRLYNEAQWEEYRLHSWVTGEMTWVSLLLYAEGAPQPLPSIIWDWKGGFEAFLNSLEDVRDGKKWHEACAMKVAIEAALSGCSFKAFQDAAWVGWRAAHNRTSRPSAADVVTTTAGNRIVALNPAGLRVAKGNKAELVNWPVAIAIAGELWIEPAKRQSFIQALHTVNNEGAVEFLHAFTQ